MTSPSPNPFEHLIEQALGARQAPGSEDPVTSEVMAADSIAEPLLMEADQEASQKSRDAPHRRPFYAIIPQGLGALYRWELGAALVVAGILGLGTFLVAFYLLRSPPSTARRPAQKPLSRNVPLHRQLPGFIKTSPTPEALPTP